MIKVLIPAISAAVLSFASVSAANAGPWGAFYPHGAHDQAGDQFGNSSKHTKQSGPDGEGKPGPGRGGSSYSGGSGNGNGNGWNGNGNGGGGYAGGGNGGGNGGNGGDGVSHSAPGPVLGLGIPAFAVAGGYAWFRRRAKKNQQVR